jgi:hypothetical protein
MEQEPEPGWHDLRDVVKAAVEERWLIRPCDACGDDYRVWSTQIELLPFCSGVKCKRE